MSYNFEHRAKPEPQPPPKTSSDQLSSSSPTSSSHELANQERRRLARTGSNSHIGYRPPSESQNQVDNSAQPDRLPCFGQNQETTNMTSQAAAAQVQAPFVPDTSDVRTQYQIAQSPPLVPMHPSDNQMYSFTVGSMSPQAHPTYQSSMSKQHVGPQYQYSNQSTVPT